MFMKKLEWIGNQGHGRGMELEWELKANCTMLLYISMDVLATALRLMSRKVELEGDKGWGQ